MGPFNKMTKLQWRIVMENLGFSTAEIDRRDKEMQEWDDWIESRLALCFLGFVSGFVFAQTFC